MTGERTGKTLPDLDTKDVPKRKLVDILKKKAVRATAILALSTTALSLAGCYKDTSAATPPQPTAPAPANPGETSTPQTDEEYNEEHERAEAEQDAQHDEEVNDGEVDEADYEKIKVDYEEFEGWNNKPGELTIDHPLSSFDYKTSPKFINSQRNIAQRFFAANGVEMNIDSNGLELTAGGEYLTKDPEAFVRKKTSELRIVYQLAMDDSDPRNIEIAKNLIPYLTAPNSEARTQVTNEIRMIELGGKDEVRYYTYEGPSEGDVWTTPKINSQADVNGRLANVNMRDQHGVVDNFSLKYQIHNSSLFRLAYIR